MHTYEIEREHIYEIEREYTRVPSLSLSRTLSLLISLSPSLSPYLSLSISLFPFTLDPPLLVPSLSLSLHASLPPSRFVCLFLIFVVHVLYVCTVGAVTGTMVDSGEIMSYDTVSKKSRQISMR